MNLEGVWHNGLGTLGSNALNPGLLTLLLDSLVPNLLFYKNGNKTAFWQEFWLQWIQGNTQNA